MEHAAVEGLGFAHFLTQTDGVGKTVLGTLLLLSIASWYLIVTRALANTLAHRKAEAFLKHFWQPVRCRKSRLRCAPNLPTTPLLRLWKNLWKPWPTAARKTSPWPAAWRNT